MDCCLASFLSVIIFVACSRDAGKLSENVKSAVCKLACCCGRHQNSDRRMTLTDHIPPILCMLDNEILYWLLSPPSSKKKRFIWVLNRNLQQQLASDRCPDSCGGKSCCLPLRQSYIRQEYFQLGHKSFTLDHVIFYHFTFSSLMNDLY